MTSPSGQHRRNETDPGESGVVVFLVHPSCNLRLTALLFVHMRLTTLQRIVREAGVTGAAIAATLGISRQAVSKKLRGETNWSVPEALHLRNILNDPDRLKKLGRETTLTIDELFEEAA